MLAGLALVFNVFACGNNDNGTDTPSADKSTDAAKESTDSTDEATDKDSVSDIDGESDFFELKDAAAVQSKNLLFANGMSDLNLQLYGSKVVNGQPAEFPFKVLSVRLLNATPVVAGTYQLETDIKTAGSRYSMLHVQKVKDGPYDYYFATSGSLEITTIESGSLAGTLKDLTYVPVVQDAEGKPAILDGGQAINIEKIDFSVDTYVEFDCTADAITDGNSDTDVDSDTDGIAVVQETSSISYADPMVYYYCYLQYFPTTNN